MKHKHNFRPSKGICPKCTSLATTLCNCGKSKCLDCRKTWKYNFLVEFSNVIQKIGEETIKRNKPLSVRRLIKYLKRLPPKAIVQLRITNQSKYRQDPIAYSGTMKNFGIGKYGSANKVVTLIAERE